MIILARRIHFPWWRMPDPPKGGSSTNLGIRAALQLRLADANRRAACIRRTDC
jgi:hypothetical protein